MALTPEQIQTAQAAQHVAARDPTAQVRVVAGPGTGKSSAIEERIRWLLEQGAVAGTIWAVSFTRASALDLRRRVHGYCLEHGQPAGALVSVSTLHSLALRTLRAAGLLIAYPVEPQVLDSWELENVFDAEFGQASGIGKKRREDIRQEHEAFWSTGLWGPPNYVPAVPPITPAERAQFLAFHGPRTQAYSCVLPGEIVRQCVSHMAAGGLDVAELLGIRDLVVDEFQDLNPADLEFVDRLVVSGVRTFVSGDDDQSIYSFRHASPAGIQVFTTKYPMAGQHTLTNCFRCTTSVLASAQQLISAYPQPNRIPKNHVSLYATSAPPTAGIVHRWQFPSGVAEATSIATSCRDLIAEGINPRDILILLSNQRVLLPGLDAALQGADVTYEPPRAEGFPDSPAGRLLLALLRILCDADDYVAHRVLLGSRSGVGIGTVSAVTDGVIANNLNYRGVFYDPLPGGIFRGRSLRALNDGRAVIAQIQQWDENDTVGQRIADIAGILSASLSPAAGGEWQSFAAPLPVDMTLQELRDFVWADSDGQQGGLLQAVLTRLGLPIPPAGPLPPRVRVMTMHGAKGLSAKVVFIPGLEEAILPGPWRRPYPGLVLEAARLLYVSITRARAACILSYTRTRVVHGEFRPQPPSRFTTSLDGPFLHRAAALTGPEIADIAQHVADL